MYLPRRHYRRLLLPPGWVALGFLLLLGCQALLTHKRQMRPQYALALDVPFSSKQVAEDWPFSSLSFLEKLRLYKPIAALKPTTHWHYFSFTGRVVSDSVNRIPISKTASIIRADIGGAQGMQVRLHQGATYDDLVYLLDLMHQLRAGDYWLDVSNQVATFYLVSEWAFLPDENASLPPFEPYTLPLKEQEQVLPVPRLSFWQLAQLTFSSFWQHPWRLTTLLFAMLSILSFYRLARPRRLAR